MKTVLLSSHRDDEVGNGCEDQERRVSARPDHGGVFVTHGAVGSVEIELGRCRLPCNLLPSVSLLLVDKFNKRVRAKKGVEPETEAKVW